MKLTTLRFWHQSDRYRLLLDPTPPYTTAPPAPPAAPPPPQLPRPPATPTALAGALAACIVNTIRVQRQ